MQEPSGVGGDKDESYLIPIEHYGEDSGCEIEMMVDPCAARSVCPPGFAPRMPREEPTHHHRDEQTERTFTRVAARRSGCRWHVRDNPFE
eukprot:930805-Pyramimonas_sp.AAC.1